MTRRRCPGTKWPVVVIDPPPCVPRSQGPIRRRGFFQPLTTQYNTPFRTPPAAAAAPSRPGAPDAAARPSLRNCRIRKNKSTRMRPPTTCSFGNRPLTCTRAMFRAPGEDQSLDRAAPPMPLAQRRRSHARPAQGLFDPCTDPAKADAGVPATLVCGWRRTNPQVVETLRPVYPLPERSATEGGVGAVRRRRPHQRRLVSHPHAAYTNCRWCLPRCEAATRKRAADFGPAPSDPAELRGSRPTSSRSCGFSARASSPPARAPRNRNASSGSYEATRRLLPASEVLPVGRRAPGEQGPRCAKTLRAPAQMDLPPVTIQPRRPLAELPDHNPPG